MDRREPTKRPPTKRGAAREQIVAATLRLIAEQGIDAVTHRAVAERAGVSPGSTTHHFTSRADLLRAAFRFYLHEADALLLELEQVTEAAEPADRVRVMVSELIDREFEDLALVRAEYELLLFASGDRELAADVRVWEARIVAGLASALEGSGSDRPVDGARALVNLVRGYELERLLNPQVSTEDFLRRVAPFLDALSPRR